MTFLTIYLTIGFIITSGVIMKLAIEEGKDYLKEIRDELLDMLVIIPFWFPLIIGIAIHTHKEERKTK